jgi:hypothetical protein
MVHSYSRNVDAYLKRIFRLQNPFNEHRANKIISIYVTTRSSEHLPERGLANVERQFQELNQFEAKSTELQSFRNLIPSSFPCNTLFAAVISLRCADSETNASLGAAPTVTLASACKGSKRWSRVKPLRQRADWSRRTL